MAIGKSSIQKRVAKAAEPAAEVKAPAAAPKAQPAPQPAPVAPVDTAVLANVAPETVEAMVGHKEDAKIEHVQVGQKMPNYLL